MQEEQDWVGRSIGPYRVEKRLGAGGMGAVYRAMDERLERPVALKHILPDSALNERIRRRFRREARAAARLNHPGIVRVHDVLTVADCDWLVMEFVEGETLASHLASHPPSLAAALKIATEIADALAIAHTEGIIHRDLKAKNILITTTGRVKILDFGLAKQILHRDGSSTSISIEGQILGTPHAMSPEQAVGRMVDSRSDLFSFGSLLYEMFTGRAPFRAKNPLEAMTKVCSHHPAPAWELDSKLPRALSGLISRLLEKNPAHRPQSASEVAPVLRRILDFPAEDRPSASSIEEPSDDATLHAESGLSKHESLSDRRQVTVISCELIAADESSGSLDPDILYSKMAEFESFVREQGARFNGHIANALGHQMAMYFGYPQAQEDAAYRAVTVAQELQKSFVSSKKLAVRTGIHTGPAIVLGSSSNTQVALGRTLETAMALQQNAEPGIILVSDTVRRLVARTHSTEETETISNEIQAFRLVVENQTASDWQKSKAPIIAREQEVKLLLDRFRSVRNRKGQVVLLSGEAGIGKSRIVRALREKVSSKMATWLLTQGTTFTKGSPLQPIIDLLLRKFEISKDADDESGLSPVDSLCRLEKGLVRNGQDPGRVASLFAALLGVSVKGKYPPLEITAQKQRELTLRALETLFLEMARQKPLILVIEDLHWIDPSTVDLLGRLIDNGTGSSLLLLLTFRPGFYPPWEQKKHLTRLNLSRLSNSGVKALIEHITDGKRLPIPVRDQIIAKTDGVPLFVEELTKNLLESESLVERGFDYRLKGPLDALSLPATLRDSLMARLDRLGGSKSVAQLAAVIGREFSFKILKTVSSIPSVSLRHELKRLQAAGLVYRKGFSSDQRYIFKHALIQDAAYESLLKKQRQRHHKEIARALSRAFPWLIESQPELLAHHYTEANIPEEGTVYWKKAGQRNFRGSAIIEAREYLEKGLEVSEQIPAANERSRQGSEIQMTLAEVLTNLEGMASPNAARAFKSAVDIAEEAGDRTRTFWSLLGLARSCNTQGNLTEGLRYATRLQNKVPPRDLDAAIFAKHLLGVTHFFKGDHDAAHLHLGESLRLDNIEREQPRVNPYIGEDPGVINLHFASLNRWFMGYASEAWELSGQALALAQRISHMYSMTYILNGIAILTQSMREPLKTIEKSEEVIRLSMKQGSWWHMVAKMYRDWAHAMLDPEESERHVQALAQGVEKFHEIGMRAHSTNFLTMLAEVAIRGRFFDIAERALDRATTYMKKSGEGHYEAEVLRLTGRLELTAGQEIAHGEDRLCRVEHKLTSAVETARRRSAKMLELRSTVDLGRLMVHKGRVSEARDLVTDIYSWFRDDFDTVDLRRARSFLEATNH